MNITKLKFLLILAGSILLIVRFLEQGKGKRRNEKHWNEHRQIYQKGRKTDYGEKYKTVLSIIKFLILAWKGRKKRKNG